MDRREDITPELLRILEDTIARAAELADEGEDYLAHFYALYLLAQFREKRAYPLVVRLCRIDEEVLDRLLGDFITEDLCRVLASVYDGDTAPIESIVEDVDVYEYVRDAAMDSLVVLVAEGAKSRDEVMAYLTSLFDGKLERSHSQVWNGLVSCATDLHPAEVYDRIGAAYSEGLVGPGFISPKDVDRALRQDPSTLLEQLPKTSRRYITNAIEEMEGWGCFDWPKPRNVEAPRTQNFVAPTPRSAKVSPNEPCPCGSGKKYKKCCGRVG